MVILVTFPYVVLVKLDCKNELNQVVAKSVKESEEILRHAVHEVDNPALSGLTCNPDYLNVLTKGCQESLESVLTVVQSDPAQLIIVASRIAHRHSVYLIQGRATSNASPDIMFGESE